MACLGDMPHRNALAKSFDRLSDRPRPDDRASRGAHGKQDVCGDGGRSHVTADGNHGPDSVGGSGAQGHSGLMRDPVLTGPGQRHLVAGGVGGDRVRERLG